LRQSRRLAGITRTFQQPATLLFIHRLYAFHQRRPLNLQPGTFNLRTEPGTCEPGTCEPLIPHSSNLKPDSSSDLRRLLFLDVRHWTFDLRRLYRFYPRLCYLTEVTYRSVQPSRFKISMRRTPQTQVDDGTNTAGFEEGFIVRPHIPDFRNEIVPGFFQAALPEIVGAVRMA
jgi:hypothetical protein